VIAGAGRRTVLLKGWQDFFDAGSKLVAKEKVLSGGHGDAVQQGLAAQVGVDQRRHHAQLGRRQPRDDILGAVLHIDGQNVCPRRSLGHGQGRAGACATTQASGPHRRASVPCRPDSWPVCIGKKRGQSGQSWSVRAPNGCTASVPSYQAVGLCAGGGALAGSVRHECARRRAGAGFARTLVNLRKCVRLALEHNRRARAMLAHRALPQVRHTKVLRREGLGSGKKSERPSARLWRACARSASHILLLQPQQLADQGYVVAHAPAAVQVVSDQDGAARRREGSGQGHHCREHRQAKVT
jgi:hypothetical protein